jgi:alpha,alpha-trehalase
MASSSHRLHQHLSVLLLALTVPACIVNAQAAFPADPTAGINPAGTNPADTLQYIHASWDQLTRSVTDCQSLSDIKVTTRPVIYLPADIPAPPAVQQLSKDCAVEIHTLPKRIEKIGDLMPADLIKAGRQPGLLYLPNKYVVPGGRFNEMYGWDSYFILLGLIADNHLDLARGIVENFWFEIEHYGGILNANRTYYLTRSQPPFLTSMIRAVYEAPNSFQDSAARRAWLEHGYAAAQRDYETWLRPEHRAGTTGLARYFDLGEGPVPEMADDSTYYADVIRWLIAHPQQSSNFLIKGSAHPDANETVRLKTTSCDLTISEVCMHAQADGYRLSKDFFLGDRTMRESGFDTSFRFGAFSGATHHYAPVCLNSLLFRYERDMAHFAHLLGKVNDAHLWEERAKHRAAAMNRYLWQPKAGIFADYDFTRGRASSYAYITSLYPLWAGIATREQAAQIESTLKTFERSGGLSQSDTNSGTQWDEPYGWAPTNYIAITGLAAYQFRDDTRRLAAAFRTTIDRGFAADSTIREKYNVVTANTNVQITTGYKTNVIGFGWTNAVYLKLADFLSTASPAPPAASPSPSAPPSDQQNQSTPH